MSLLFNMLSRWVTAYLPRSKCLLISWLQSPSAVILEPKKIKSVMVSIVSLSTCHEVMGPDVMIFIFWMLNFKPAFSLSSLATKNVINLISVLTIWWCPCVKLCLVLLEKAICYDPFYLLAEFSELLSCFIFFFPKAKLACYSRYLFTSYFCILVPNDE